MPPQAATCSQPADIASSPYRTSPWGGRGLRAGAWAAGAALVAAGTVAGVALSKGAASALLVAGFVASGGVLLAASLRAVRRWPAVRSLVAPRVALVGDGLATEVAAKRLTGGGAGRLVGVFPTDGMSGEIGTSDLYLNIVRGDVDAVAIVTPLPASPTVDAALLRLAAMAVDVAIYDEEQVVRGNSLALPRPVRRIRRPLDGWRMVGKDVEDRVLGLVLLIFFAPVLALVAIGVKLTSPGPVFFMQRRHGFRGQEILVYKFRSMRSDLADYSGGNQTTRMDPRVTPLGRILRATSLDELPQLINVVRGEMSLVGPRPHPVGMRTAGLLCHDIVENYDSRHRVRPGITGWAQINGYRGATTTREQVEGRVRLDNDYIEHWSLVLDLRIMLLTGVRLFADANAY